MPKQIRNLFCTICVFSNPTYPLVLFNKYKQFLIEDYLYQKNSNEMAINKCLIEFQHFFQQHNKNCSFFGLPDPIYYSEDSNETINITNEASIGQNLKTKLNTDQLNAVNTILKALDDRTNKVKAFFIDGPGGTGKTFVYNTLTHILRGQK